MKVWICKIGIADDVDLPDGADAPMRAAASSAFTSVVGSDAEFCFSGWGGKLDEVEEEYLKMKGVIS